MSIDLDKNRSAILKAYDDVLNDKKPTDWILLGYEGQTNTLKVVGTGDGGLEELADELNSSKVMYAVVRVTDPKTTRTKYVLINWVGEACQDMRMGICSRHLHDVKGLLKGVHVTFNARSEEEVESEQVFAALAKSTATSYDFSERSEHEESNAPVGTNYKRTNPLSEINTSSRNRFWQEQELEEQSRKEEEIKRKQQEEQLIEQERRKKELASSSCRDQAVQERSARAAATRRASEAAEERLRAAATGGATSPTVEEAEREEQERARRAELMRRERKQEAESVIGSSTKSARSLFEQCPVAAVGPPNGGVSRPPPRKLKDFTPLNSQPHSDDHSSSGGSGRGAVSRAWPPPSNSSGAPVQEERRARQPMFRDGSSERTAKAPVAPGRLSPVGAAQAPSVTNPRAAAAAPATHEREPYSASNVYESEPRYTPNVYESEPYSTPNVYETEPPLAPSVYGSKPSSSNVYESAPYVSGSKTSSTANAKGKESAKVPMFPPKHEPASSSNVYESEPLPASHGQPLSRGAPTDIYESEPPVPARGQPATNNASSMYEDSYPVERSTHGLAGAKINRQEHSAVGAVNSNGGNYQATNGPTEHRYDSVPVEYDAMYGEPHEEYSGKAAQPSLYQSAQDPRRGDGSPGPASPHLETTPSVAMTYEVDGIEYQLLPEHGLCARALYDYQASDDTEISFDPSEIISNIEQIDEGWWQGVGPNGNFGLFPANYVELINAAAPNS